VVVWRRARTQLLRQPPDLLSLAPVGELLLAGARLGDRGTVLSCQRRVHDLLARLGEPPLWALPVRWDDLHIAIALDDLAAVRLAAEHLEALVPAGPRVQVLPPAARAWVDALSGEVQPDRIRTVAEDLAAAGWAWHAARLAGAAAIRTPDSADMRGLLHLARSLPAPSASSLVDKVGELSAREQEVAAHLLNGLTYRQIGAQLFIAPKTVEHHVARIRRKLGVSSRAELLIALRRHLPAGGPVASPGVPAVDGV
jgi:DNA-binding CsgD family transcriptional regulator